MCKILDDALPIIGAVVGSVIPGVGTAIGASLGAAAGGFAGNYFQTHNFGDALGAGAMAGGTTYLGAGLAQGLGSAATDSAGSGFTLGGTGVGGGAGTTGAMESGLGGAAMFGPNAGTGTAIGGASGALGGNGVGIAGADTLGGVSATGGQYFAGLGGGGAGTGLGTTTASGPASQADLQGALGQSVNSNITGAGSGATGAATPTSPGNSALGTLSNASNVAPQPTAGALGGTSTGGSLEGVQAAQSPVSADMNGVGGGGGVQAATMGYAPGGEAGGGTNLSTMFGPDSTAQASPMGAATQSSSAVGGPYNTVQAGALGEAAPTSGGSMDLSSLFGGGNGTTGQLSPWMGLAKAGLGAYQQYAQQQANQNYVNSINQMFSPDSPYAQQMSQTLGRQDAAAGRNSQYGTRAVQLAAALTQARANALGNSNYAHAAMATPGANMANSLFAMFANPQYAQGLQQLGTAGFNGLQSLFGG
jgi:hypothetical protein